MKKILILEDEVRNFRVLESMLSDSFQLTHVVTPKDVRNQVENTTFDLFIFDIKIEGYKEDGISIANDLSFRHGIETPVLFITQYPNDEHYRQRSNDLGAVGFYSKDELDEKEKLLKIIENIFAQSTIKKISNRIAFKDGQRNRYFFYNLDDLLYLTSYQGTTVVSFSIKDKERKEKKHIFSTNLGVIGNQLAKFKKSIIQVNRSFYVNIDRIAFLENDTDLTFENGISINLKYSSSMLPIIGEFNIVKTNP